MKQIISTIVIVILLSGCAKVSEETLPCTGAKPTTPVVQSVVVVPSYGSSYVYAASTAGATFVWSGPNGFSRTGNPISIDFYSSNNYGQYSVKAYLSNGCSSDAATFDVAATAPLQYGSPSCTPANSNVWLYNNSLWLQFPSALYGSSGSTKYSISGTDGSYKNVSIYLPTSANPVAGTYYDIDSNATYQSGGAAIYVDDQYNSKYYSAVSGKIFIKADGTGHNAVVLCGANFNGSNGRFSVTGTVIYY